MLIAIIADSDEKRNGSLFSRLYSVLAKIKHHKFIIIANVVESDPAMRVMGSKRFRIISPCKSNRISQAEAMELALGKKPDLVIQIHLSRHPVEMIPALIREIEKGCDVVIASRYMGRGSGSNNSGIRKGVSIAANILFRPLSGMFEIRDCTSGLRAMKAQYLIESGFEHIRPGNYAFQAELAYRLKRAGARIKEIPFAGPASKNQGTALSKESIFNFFIRSVYIAIEVYKTFITFIIVGIIASLFNLAMLYFFVSILGIDKNIAAPSISLEAAMLLSFYLNDKFTFANRDKDKFLKRLGRFHLAAISGFIFNLLVYNLILNYGRLELLAGKLDYILAQIAATCIVTFWNFYISSAWTWKKPATNNQK